MKVLLLVLAGVVSAWGQGSCPPGFSFYGNSCYYVVASEVTWFQADQYCTSLAPKSYRIHLASIETSGEDNFLRTLVQDDPDTRFRNVWFSLTQIDKNRRWVWANTQVSPSYTNWGTNPSTSGKCAYMSNWYNYRWDHGDCYSTRSFVCEYPLNSITPPTTCPPNTLRYGRSCYYMIPSSLTWFDAEQYCTMLSPRTYNTHLVSIESAAEMNFLRNEIKRNSMFRSRDLWTGGNSLYQGRSWHWLATQRDASYSNWAPGEPNNSGKCIQLWHDRDWRWDDNDCEDEPRNHGFICEVEL